MSENAWVTFEEWEAEQLNINTTKSYYAELAWNAAIEQARQLVIASMNSENNMTNMMVLQLEELKHLDTGFGTGLGMMEGE